MSRCPGFYLVLYIKLLYYIREDHASSSLCRYVCMCLYIAFADYSVFRKERPLAEKYATGLLSRQGDVPEQEKVLGCPKTSEGCKIRENFYLRTSLISIEQQLFFCDPTVKMSNLQRSLNVMFKASRASLQRPRAVNPVQHVLSRGMGARQMASAFQRTKPHVNIGR